METEVGRQEPQSSTSQTGSASERKSGHVADLLRSICTEESGVNCVTLEQVILLAAEIAREGREGRKIGTLFVVSDSAAVLQMSRCLILDPLWYHPTELKHVSDPDMRETAKELAQLDGAFIVSDDGVFLSASRYLSASPQGIQLPLGLGSRHLAAASITRDTNAFAVVVSESSAVRIFHDGKIVAEIIPELWLLHRHGLHTSRPYTLVEPTEVTVVQADDL